MDIRRIRPPKIVLTYLSIGLCTCLLLFLINPQLLSHDATEKSEQQGSIIARDDIEITSDPVAIVSNDEPEHHNTGYERKLWNILFLMVDDLRPQLGSYFDPEHPTYLTKSKMITPNLDELASKSLLLKRAYVQQALCGPSRASILTSRRPDMTRAFTNNRYWRETGGNFTTIPQIFKENGYISLGFGKIFHTGLSSNNDDPISWSEKFFKPVFSDTAFVPVRGGAGWAMVSEEERAKAPLSDDETITEVSKAMQKLAPKAITGEQPFFLAVGFRKPHLSFICPKEYFDLYPVESEAQYLSDMTWQTPSVRKMCELGQLDVNETDGSKRIPEDRLRSLRRGYSACVSYTDSNIGAILNELDRHGLSNSTIVSFIADHGYHLGENNEWGKMTPYEISLHVPLMLRIPGQTDHGIVSDSIVEALDLYPTLVEASGLEPMKTCPTENSQIQACTQGESFLPLIKYPKLKIKDAAYSQVTALDDTTYSVRTEQFRYNHKGSVFRTELADGKFQYGFKWGTKNRFTEMFDHDVDPEERFDVGADTKYVSQRSALRTKLRLFVDDMHLEPKII